MRGRTPTLHCDAEDGFCGSWEVDYFEALAFSVDGTPVTAEERAPGWASTRDSDYCPDHRQEAVT